MDRKESNRLYRLNNKDKIRKCRQDYYLKNKDLIKKKVKDYFLSNPDKNMAKARRVHLLRQYNMTEEDFNVMLQNQEGVCAICKEKELSKRCKYLHVDHDHNSKKVRGLLCSNCNRGLGLFKDSAELLEKASQYLRKDNNGSS